MADAVGGIFWFVVMFLIFWSVTGWFRTAGKNLKRIADVLERAEQRANGRT
jgi:hypothetical protein